MCTGIAFEEPRVRICRQAWRLRSPWSWIWGGATIFYRQVWRLRSLGSGFVGRHGRLRSLVAEPPRLSTRYGLASWIWGGPAIFYRQVWSFEESRSLGWILGWIWGGSGVDLAVVVDLGWTDHILSTGMAFGESRPRFCRQAWSFEEPSFKTTTFYGRGGGSRQPFR